MNIIQLFLNNHFNCDRQFNIREKNPDDNTWRYLARRHRRRFSSGFTRDCRGAARGFSGAQSGKWCMTDGGGYDNSSVGYPRGENEEREKKGATQEEKEENEAGGGGGGGGREGAQGATKREGTQAERTGNGRAGGRRTFAPSRWSSPRVIELGRIGRTILRLPSSRSR